jgi:hypothetical protein
MHGFLQIFGVVAEIAAAALIGILLDRWLGDVAAVIGLCICAVFLGWLHWGEIKSMFVQVPPSQVTATPLPAQPASPIPEITTKPPAADPPREKPPEKPRSAPVMPEVTLRFVYPDFPSLVITNPSKILARDIKWTVALWNMDLPDRNDPLPIPVQVFDWIRPHEEGGPEDLFNTPLVNPLLKTGDRLFGSASVICPDCSRGRTYAVYIVWGKGGWFYEVPNDISGHIIVPSNFGRETREVYFQQLDSMVPQEKRVPIGAR